MIARARVASIAGALVFGSSLVSGHDGPPFPIVSDHVSGPYLISVWTDPDTTDDGSAGGQFWVRLHVAGTREPVPEGTRAHVAIKPIDRRGPERTSSGTPVRGDITNQFAGVPMDHEGRFAVHVTVNGPLGTAGVDAVVDATYDVRPSPSLLFLYLAPFLVVGLLWGRLLLRRRATRQRDDVR